MKTKLFPYAKSLLIFFIFMFFNLIISFSIQFLFYINQINIVHFKILLSLTFMIPLIFIYIIFFRKIKIIIYFYNNIYFYIIILLLSYSIQIFGTTIEIWSISFIPNPYREYYEQLKELLYPKTSLELIFSIINIGFIAPICEELLFREFIFKNTLKNNNFILSNLYQAFLFGLAHLNPFQFLYAVPIGILFGWIYHKTQNFLIPVLIHMTINTMTILLSIIHINDPILKEFLKFGEDTSSIYELSPIPIILSTLILFLSLYFLLRINKKWMNKTNSS